MNQRVQASNATRAEAIHPLAGSAPTQSFGPHMKVESHKIVATGGKLQRISALDFTKGALVLIMVLYHWIDYFIGSGLDLFRYLRFLTPSFICISGFLISAVYLAKYDTGDPRIPKRLAERGLKILGLFILLNVFITLAFRTSYSGKIVFGDFSVSDLTAVFVTGNNLVAGVGKAAAFYVLVPISYLLLLSAGLVIVYKFYRFAFETAFFVCLLSVLVLSLKGLQSANLELVTIGFLGVIIGYIPFEKINRITRHPYLLVGAYLGYTVLITIWNVKYLLQIVGVCLSLALLYLMGASGNDPGRVRNLVILLGKYSLLGYIVQILILQVLRRVFRLVELGPGMLAVSFFAAVALTIIAVVAVDRARARSTAVDGLYRTVFS